jgi:hypothetical protein
MAKFDFQYTDAPGQIVLRAEADPGHFSGGRNAFGPILLLRLQWLYDASIPRHRPLAVQGTLQWGADPNGSEGLAIPLQAVTLNGPVRIPVSDDQLAQLEERRAGGEPDFAVRFEALVQREAPAGADRTPDLAVRTVTHGYMAQPLAVSRDAWARILDRCGFGLRRMVELPPPPGGLGGKWDEASMELAGASKLLAQANDEQAIAAVRKALERIVEGVAAAVGEPPPSGKGGFGPYVVKLADRIKAMEPARSHPFHLVASLLRTTFDFASGHAHGSSASSRRDEAVFAVALGTSLYAFAAHGALAASFANQGDAL